MALSVTRVVNALLCSDELYCPLHQSGVAVAGATNAVNRRQSEAVTVSLFIPPPRPHAFNPISPTHGHFVLSPVSLASRDQDGGVTVIWVPPCFGYPRTQNTESVKYCRLGQVKSSKILLKNHIFSYEALS